MERFLLDTDAIVDHLKRFRPTVELILQLDTAGGELCTCDVVIAEVHAGLNPKDRQPAHDLLEACTYLPSSPQIAQQAGEWRYQYARRGRSIALSDALIAATAHAHRATIVTGNEADYPMPELSTVRLPRPGPRRKGR